MPAWLNSVLNTVKSKQRASMQVRDGQLLMVLGCCILCKMVILKWYVFQRVSLRTVYQCQEARECSCGNIIHELESHRTLFYFPRAVDAGFMTESKPCHVVSSIDLAVYWLNMDSGSISISREVFLWRGLNPCQRWWRCQCCCGLMLLVWWVGMAVTQDCYNCWQLFKGTLASQGLQDWQSVFGCYASRCSCVHVTWVSELYNTKFTHQNKKFWQ